MRIDSIKTGDQLKRWRTAYKMKNGKPLTRNAFSFIIGVLGVSKLQEIENKNLPIDENLIIIMKEKFK